MVGPMWQTPITADCISIELWEEQVYNPVPSFLGTSYSQSFDWVTSSTENSWGFVADESQNQPQTRNLIFFQEQSYSAPEGQTYFFLIPKTTRPFPNFGFPGPHSCCFLSSFFLFLHNLVIFFPGCDERDT